MTFTEVLFPELEAPVIVILSPSRIPIERKSSSPVVVIVLLLLKLIVVAVILASIAVESTTRFKLVAFASNVSL